jgi:tetratricopeptide (TPR) repeat protein
MMTCKNCGSAIDEGIQSCPNCGQSIASFTKSAAPESSPPDLSALLTNTQDASTGLQGNHAKKLRRVVLAVVGLAMLVILFLIIAGSIRQKNYEAASALFDAKQYTKAVVAFTKLGNFKDSTDRAAQSQNWADYTRASDLIELYSHDDAVEAKQIFLSLGNFEDSADMAVLCQNRIDYDAADALETAGDFAAAQAAFESLGSYNNASERARFCSDTLDYQAASALMIQGDYAAAAEKMEAPAQSSFEDAGDKLELCNNKVAFAAAEQKLADGRNYEAYEAFSELGNFDNAFLRAEACILPTPKTGELYHNEKYNFSQTELTVYNTNANESFLKLYSVNGDLVCSFYIAAGSKATVRVPEGTYTLNQAYGTRWFGLQDMFGDDGEYYRQIFGDSYEFTMDSDYIYEISTRDTADGTHMNDDDTSRTAF